MVFSNRDCNYPQPIFATWWLTQFRRWGMVKGAPDYQGVSARVLRPDLYTEAMKEMGTAPKIAPLTKVSLFDSTLDLSDPEGYARSFSVNSLA
jgi:nitrate/nitrite transport system substrate-binding protein